MLNTQVKSWQRVVGTASTGAALVLALSSVNPAKCLIFVDGCQWSYDAVTIGTSSIASVHRYVSAFSATSLTLTISGIGAGNTFVEGIFSVIVVELY